MLSILPRLPAAHIRARSLAKARTAPGSGFTPPYSLPSAGTAVAIGTNSFQDIVPGALTTTQWNTIVWRAYGSGVFVADYSEGGAYVAVGNGGHTDGRAYGGPLFDFADATWKRLDATNTGTTYSATNHSTADTGGTPYYELTGSSGAPVPGHAYNHKVVLSAALGGGTKGSILNVGRAAACAESVTSGGTHKAALGASDLTWSRYNDSTTSRVTTDQCNVLDEARSRVWVLPNNLENYQNVEYLDLTDGTFKTAGAFGGFPSSGAGGVGWAFLHSGYVIKRGSSSTLWLYDNDNPTSRWQSLTTSGTFPASTLNRPAAYGGKFYWMPEGGGSTLTRLTPPADPVAGTWAFDTVTVTGDTIPAHTTAVSHYSALCYVPAIDCLAWFSGSTNSVLIIKPE